MQDQISTIEVVAAVIRDGDRIFAMQRGYGDFKDMWELPADLKVLPRLTDLFYIPM